MPLESVQHRVQCCGGYVIKASLLGGGGGGSDENFHTRNNEGLKDSI